ncbi:MAG TPA: PAS domain-containing sensor histidine kinase [Chryseosolibacter sp.]|nr:PAS domain-containing sensor histidine kinase [Chryseosolibacter sp.]
MIDIQTILDHMTESMILIDMKGTVLFFNKVALTYEELARKQLRKGCSIFDMLPEEYVDFTQFVIQEVSSKHVSHTAEAVFQHPTGHSVFFELNYNPVLDADNNVVQICIIGRDITPQKTFEKKTSQLIRELSNLIESANAVIFGIDGQGYITEWNKECIRLTGFEKNEVFAQRVKTILDENYTEEFQVLITRVLQGESVSNSEFKINRKNADPVTILLSGTPKISAAGKVVGALFVGQDVTELSEYRQSLERKVKDRTRQLQEALQKEKELVELKNKFVSIASHEFKIPLNAINATVASLKKSIQAGTQMEKLDAIESHVNRMKGLLEDVLAAGKNEANKLKSNKERIDLVAFLNKISDEVTMATGNTHQVVRTFTAAQVEIESDEKLLRNVFVNLISNAIKFSPQRKEIHLAVSRPGKDVRVVIRDFGIGIEPDDLERVFQPFNRGSNIGSIKGTGLGLSIVKKAVETLGGDIDVQSRVGEGTTFTVTFHQ